MSTSFILRRRPTAAFAAVALSGIGIFAATSYFTNNSYAESPSPPIAFSSRFGTSLRLESSEIVNHNTKRLRFEFPNPNSRSGLVLTSSVLVVAWPKGRLFPVLRPYTPVTSFDETGHLDLMVKKYPNGKASTYIHSLSPGDTLYFTTTLKGYQWKLNSYPHVMLIAGGAGITPIYQLTQGILHNPEDNTKITLVFGVNSDADVLLRKEFKEFEEKFPGRFRAVYTVSNPAVGSEFRKGYVTKELLEEMAEKGKKEQTKVFVCGPPAMEKSLLGQRKSGGILEDLGYRKDQIHSF